MSQKIDRDLIEKFKRNNARNFDILRQKLALDPVAEVAITQLENYFVVSTRVMSQANLSKVRDAIEVTNHAAKAHGRPVLLA